MVNVHEHRKEGRPGDFSEKEHEEQQHHSRTDYEGDLFARCPFFLLNLLYTTDPSATTWRYHRDHCCNHFCYILRALLFATTWRYRRDHCCNHFCYIYYLRCLHSIETLYAYGSRRCQRHTWQAQMCLNLKRNTLI